MHRKDSGNMGDLKYAVDYGVIGLLAVLALCAMVMAVERWLFYKRLDPSQFPVGDL